MDLKIIVSLFRVSLNSLYLDLIADTNDNFLFNLLELEIRHPNHEGKLVSDYFDLSNVLDTETAVTKLSIRIPLNKLFVQEDIAPSIYILSLKAIDPNGEEADYVTSSVTSDVLQAFYYILDNILDLENDCQQISDEAIRNYLILYGHQQALSNGEMDIAEEYFKVLIKNFSKCGNNNRSCANNNCGCKDTKQYNSCGCKQ